MTDEQRRMEQLRREVESEMALDDLWLEEYKSVLAEEIAADVRAQARKQAEADVRRYRNGKKNVSK